jgi:hypothetical protein
MYKAFERRIYTFYEEHSRREDCALQLAIHSDLPSVLITSNADPLP